MQLDVARRAGRVGIVGRPGAAASVAADALGLVGGMALALALWGLVAAEPLDLGRWPVVAAGGAAALLALFAMLGHYRRFGRDWRARRRDWAEAALLSAGAAGLELLASGDGVAASAWLATMPGVAAARLAVRRLWPRDAPALVIGGGAHARAAAATLRSRDSGAVTVVPQARLLRDDTVARDRLDSLLRRTGAGLVVLAPEAIDVKPLRRLIEALSRRPVNVALVPPVRGLWPDGCAGAFVAAPDLVMMTSTQRHGMRGDLTMKRAFDLGAASVLLALLAPVMAVIALAIRRDGGPAFYGHARIGRFGRTFRCLKFRTMAVDADKRLEEVLARDPLARAEWQSDFKLRDDPRVTPIGRFLRRSSLDELPQLINVLRGEMSLVGPRPIVSDEIPRYGDDIDYYLMCPGGITGLWQVSGRNDVGYARRVALDAWYARNWSFLLDLVILVRTVFVLLRRTGAY